MADKAVADFPDRETVVRTYVADMRQLEAVASGWREFLQTLCRRSVKQSTGPGVPSRQRNTVYEELISSLTKFEEDPVDDQGLLQARLLTPEKTKAALFEELHGSLRDVVERLATALVADLDGLVDGNVVGFIEWTDESVCCFEYFEHRLESVRDRQRKQVLSENITGIRNPNEFQQYGDWVRRRKVKNRLQGRHLREVVRKEQHLMGASAQRLTGEGVVIPRQFSGLVEKIPSELAPFFRVVTGETFKELEHKYAVHEQKWTEVFVREELRTHFDPALTLGPFVLWGWGPEVCEQEQALRSAEAAGKTFWEQAAWTAITVCVALVMFVGGLQAWPPLSVLAMLIAVGGLYPLSRAAKSRAHRQHRTADWYFLSLAGCAYLSGVMTLFCGVLLLLRVGGWLPLAGLPVSGVVTWMLVQQTTVAAVSRFIALKAEPHLSPPEVDGLLKPLDALAQFLRVSETGLDSEAFSAEEFESELGVVEESLTQALTDYVADSRTLEGLLRSVQQHEPAQLRLTDAIAAHHQRASAQRAARLKQDLAEVQEEEYQKRG